MEIIVIKRGECKCKRESNYDCNKCHNENVEFTKALNYYFDGHTKISRYFKRSHYKWKRQIKKNFINKLKKIGKK